MSCCLFGGELPLHIFLPLVKDDAKMWKCRCKHLTKTGVNVRMKRRDYENGHYGLRCNTLLKEDDPWHHFLWALCNDEVDGFCPLDHSDPQNNFCIIWVCMTLSYNAQQITVEGDFCDCIGDFCDDWDGKSYISCGRFIGMNINQRLLFS